jgi:hypothetical protein
MKNIEAAFEDGMIPLGAVCSGAPTMPSTCTTKMDLYSRFLAFRFALNVQGSLIPDEL